MLWTTLHNRISRQPLAFTAHNHVEAVIDDKRIRLELKYDAKGRPYFVKSDRPAKSKS